MTKTIEEIAQEVAEKLFQVQEKEILLKANEAEIQRHEAEIKFLEEANRKLKQEISSERYLIAERIGKQAPENLQVKK